MTTTNIEKMLKESELRWSMQIIMKECFDILYVFQSVQTDMFMSEIAETLGIQISSRLVAFVNGLVASGYIQAHESGEETIYSVHYSCDPLLPLPYLTLIRYMADDRTN